MAQGIGDVGPFAGKAPSRQIHDAFISYSHHDAFLGPALEKALERLATPFWRRRTSDVFLDQSSLGVDTGVWSAIEPHLEGSRWFVLLASPESATSSWCQREVAWWIEHRGSGRMLIVVTAGELVPTADMQDFDWPQTTALPALLAGRFHGVPLYGDLRMIARRRAPSLKDPAFRNVVIGLAATIRGMRRDELDAEDLRVHRRNLRAITLGTSLFLIAGGVAAWKTKAEIDAARIQRVSSLAKLSWQVAETRPAEAALMGALSQRLGGGGEATLALVNALQAHPRLERVLISASADGASVAIDGAGDRIAIARCDALPSCPNLMVELQNIAGKATTPATLGPMDVGALSDMAFAADGRSLLLVAAEAVHLLDLSVTGAKPKMMMRGQPVAAAALSPDGTMLAVAMGPARNGVDVKIWKLAEATRRCDPLVMPDVARRGLAWSPKGHLLAATDGRGTVVVMDLEHCRRTTLRSGDTTGTVGFDADGQTLLAPMLDGTLLTWSVGTAERMNIIGVDKPLVIHPSWLERSPHSLSPDGRLLALADDDQIRISAATNLDVVEKLAGYSARVTRTQFSSDGRWVASSHADGAVMLWRLQGQRSLVAEVARDDPRLTSLEASWQRTSATRSDGSLRALVRHQADREAGRDTPGDRWVLELEAVGSIPGQTASSRVLASGASEVDPPEAVTFDVAGSLWVRTESGRIFHWAIGTATLEATACRFANHELTAAEIDKWLVDQYLLRWRIEREPLCQKSLLSAVAKSHA